MKTILITLAIFLALGIAKPTNASLMGNVLMELSQKCDLVATSETTTDRGWACAAMFHYVVAVNDTFNTYHHVGAVPKFYCLPPDVTHGQMIEAVKKYLDDHPEKLNHYVAASLIMNAFVSTFPCK